MNAADDARLMIVAMVFPFEWVKCLLNYKFCRHLCSANVQREGTNSKGDVSRVTNRET